MLKRIYELELGLHQNNWIAADECLKQNLGTNEICKYIMDVAYPGVFQNWMPKKFQQVLTFYNKMKEHYLYMICAMSIRILVYYLDLAKDLILLYGIWIFVNPSITNFTIFSTQLIFCYLASIILPLLINAVKIICFELEEFCGSFKRQLQGRIRITMQILSFYFILLAPAFIIYQKGKKMVSIRRLNTKMASIIKTRDKIGDMIALNQQAIQLRNEVAKLKNLLVTHSKTELFEVLFQTVITFMALSMSSSLTRTVSGLQGFFETSKGLLFLAIFLSIKKLTLANIHVQKPRKVNFSALLGSLFMDCMHYLHP